MSTTLTQQEIDNLISSLKTFPYLVSVGDVCLGPLSGAPTCDPDTETKDVVLYETEGEIEAKLLTKNSVTLTLRTRNVDAAMPLVSAIKKGDNILASTNKKVITLVPITGESEKTITFDNAYLNPGLSFAPGENKDPHVVTLTYECKADPTRGTPFTYETPSSGSGT